MQKRPDRQASLETRKMQWKVTVAVVEGVDVAVGWDGMGKS